MDGKGLGRGEGYMNGKEIVEIGKIFSSEDGGVEKVGENRHGKSKEKVGGRQEEDGNMGDWEEHPRTC